MSIYDSETAIAYRLLPMDQNDKPRWGSEITATSEGPTGVGERLPVGNETWLVIEVEEPRAGDGKGLMSAEAADGTSIHLGGTLFCRRVE